MPRSPFAKTGEYPAQPAGGVASTEQGKACHVLPSALTETSASSAKTLFGSSPTKNGFSNTTKSAPSPSTIAWPPKPSTIDPPRPSDSTSSPPDVVPFPSGSPYTTSGNRSAPNPLSSPGSNDTMHDAVCVGGASAAQPYGSSVGPVGSAGPSPPHPTLARPSAPNKTTMTQCMGISIPGCAGHAKRLSPLAIRTRNLPCSAARPFLVPPLPPSTRCGACSTAPSVPRR